MREVHHWWKRWNMDIISSTWLDATGMRHVVPSLELVARRACLKRFFFILQWNKYDSIIHNCKFFHISIEENAGADVLVKVGVEWEKNDCCWWPRLLVGSQYHISFYRGLVHPLDRLPCFKYSSLIYMIFSCLEEKKEEDKTPTLI